MTTAGFPQGSLGCNPLHLSNRRVTFLKICPLPPVDKITMLSKCATPCCSATFRYLSRGKLYRWDTSAAAKGKELSFGTDAQAQSATRRIEFFWLCEQCAPTMTLVFEKGMGVVPSPLLRAKAAAAATLGRSVRLVG